MTVRGIRRRSGIDAGRHEANDMIASMAKGIAEVQSGATDQADIVNMLQQISQQLGQLQGQPQPINSGQPMQESESEPVQEESAPEQDDSSQQPDSLAELQRLVSQLAQNQRQQPDQTVKQNAGGKQANGQINMRKLQQKITQKTAARALNDAQYELSVELENSLKKLKQVISESEKLADKITNLIGEETSKRS